MKPPSRTRQFKARVLRFAALLLVLVQLPGLLRTAADPSQSDFGNYFTPAFVLADGGEVGALYDRETFNRSQIRAGIRVLGSFIPHPPANALWLLAFAGESPAVAKGMWTAVLAGATFLTIAAVSRLSAGLGLAMAVILVLSPVFAVRNGLAFGQPYLVLSAWLALGALALERGREFLGGFLLGLGVSFKPHALLLGAAFLHRDRLRSLTGFLVGAAGPSLLLLWLAGREPFHAFATRVLPWMMRGEIQDPFSPVWGSAMALANRLFRFEPDLNPHPWLVAPGLARFVGGSVAVTLLGLGALTSRKAMGSGRPLDGVAAGVAFAMAASPFTASYHLVLLVIPVAVLTSRVHGRWRLALLFGWCLLGSNAANVFRSAEGAIAPLAYLRFFILLGLALAVARPYLTRRTVGTAALAGLVAGVLASQAAGRTEAWPRIESARGYSSEHPYYCGASLRWWSPSADGRRLESRGEGEDCVPPKAPQRVLSRFTDGSWNLYLTGASGEGRRITFSDANELEPVETPDGCAVVFASDQGRGLGSTALYRMDVPDLNPGCGEDGRVAARP